MALFRRLETLPLPVVSIVDGFALGGGNELAMSTHYRIVTENAVIGQPEVKLGIIPGYGGMQRLPRLIGPRRAAEMAVNGESVDGRTAVMIGLAQEFHPSCTALAKSVSGGRRAPVRCAHRFRSVRLGSPRCHPRVPKWIRSTKARP